MHMISRSTLGSSLPNTAAGFGRQDIFVFLALTAIWIAMAAFVNPIGNFPLNDDWVYAQAVQSLLDTGRYKFLSETSANVGPQIYWGALFCLPTGFSFTALRFSTLTLGLIGTLVLYSLVLEATQDRKLSTLAALCLVANPLYFSLSNTFMTDIPFVVVMLIASALLTQGLSRESRSYIVAGIITAFAAILIRQLGIVILFAYAAALLAKRGVSFRNAIFGLLPILAGLAIHFGYQYWITSTGRVPVLTIHSSVGVFIPDTDRLVDMLKTIAAGILYSGFFIAPFVALYATFERPKLHNLSRKSGTTLWISFAVVVMSFSILLYAQRLLPHKGNIMIPAGIGPLTLLDTYVLNQNLPVITALGRVLWGALTLVALASIVYTVNLPLTAYGWHAKHLLRNKPHSKPPNWNIVYFSMLGLSYLAILVLISGKVPIFDRYYIIFLPILILILSNASSLRKRVQGRISTAVSVSLIFASAIFSILATHDYLSFNRTRWAALNDLQRQGVSPSNIDGGYEFNGIYTYDPKYRRQPGKGWWWVVDDKYVIASGMLPNYSEVRRYSFQRWVLGTQSAIFVLRRNE